MQWWEIVLLTAAALYLLFVLIPSLLVLHLVLRRKSLEKLEGRDLRGTYYDPYLEDLREAAEKLHRKITDELLLTAYDGITLAAEYADNGSDRTAILFHGYNATPEKNCAAYALYFLEQGYNVCLPHMRGHGKSGGLHSSLGLREQEDVLSWCAYFDFYPGLCETVVLGVSMGAEALAYASDRLGRMKRLRAVILDCAYQSPYRVFRPVFRKKRLPYRLMMPVMLFGARVLMGLQVKQEPAVSLRKATVPTLFITGSADTTVPVEQMRYNYENCAAPKRLLIVDGAEHALSVIHDPELVKGSISAFLQETAGNGAVQNI